MQSGNEINDPLKSGPAKAGPAKTAPPPLQISKRRVDNNYNMIHYIANYML